MTSDTVRGIELSAGLSSFRSTGNRVPVLVVMCLATYLTLVVAVFRVTGPLQATGGSIPAEPAKVMATPSSLRKPKTDPYADRRRPHVGGTALRRRPSRSSSTILLHPAPAHSGKPRRTYQR
jgi:hypothetical protein